MAEENKAQSLKGKAKQVAGFAAGDREVEAEGQLDQLDAADPGGGEEGDAEAAQAVAEAKEEVRKDHGDIH